MKYGIKYIHTQIMEQWQEGSYLLMGYVKTERGLECWCDGNRIFDDINEAHRLLPSSEGNKTGYYRVEEC